MPLDVARAVFASVALGAAAYGAGFWMETALPASFSRSDRLACSWLGGLGILGSGLFLIGQIDFTPLIIATVIGLCVLVAFAAMLRGSSSPLLAARELAPISVLPAIIICFVLVVTIVAGCAEITGDWGNDAVAYHLLGPKVWLREGIVRPVLDNSHTAFPATAEILFGVLMALGGRLAPGLSAALTLALFFLIVFSVSRRAGLDRDGAWWCVALVAAMPAVYAGAHSAFIDVLFASFVLAAARIGFDAERPKEYAAFGLFCGLAVATKYTGLLAMPALVLCAVLAKSKARRLGSLSVWQGAGVAIAAACVPAAAFYIRNWILLGCPIYPPPPILSNICHAKYLSADAIQRFHAYIHARGAGLGRGPGAYLMLPFNLTYHTSNFHGAGGIGLCALALGPFGVVAAWREVFSRTLALLGWLLLTLWFLTQQESRFLIHVYVIGAIFAVLGWRYVVTVAPRYCRLLCGTVVALSVLYGCFMIGVSRKDNLHSAVSASFAAQQRGEHIPFYASFEYLNRDPAVHKVLILDQSVPPYYLDKEYLKPFGQWGERVLPGIEDSGEVLKRLRELGITHVLDVRSEIWDFQVPGKPPNLTLVFERPGERVYRVE